ncbi:uncharacterized protein LOC144115237 isoform X3 [Amblyomma americanum]
MNAGHKALEPSGTKTDAIEPRASTSKASESAARIQETREAQSLRNATPEKGAGPAKKEPSNLTECVPGNLEARSGENLLPKGQICKTLSSRIMQLHLCCQALNLDDPKMMAKIPPYPNVDSFHKAVVRNPNYSKQEESSTSSSTIRKHSKRRQGADAFKSANAFTGAYCEYDRSYEPGACNFGSIFPYSNANVFMFMSLSKSALSDIL